MISVQEAQSAIQAQVKPLPSRMLPLAQALRLTLAADVFAETDIPAFAQSSMDGYAIRFQDHAQALLIQGEMQAGATAPFRLEAMQAARIFTGAPLPQGADTVVMQEKVRVEDGRLIVEDALLTMGSNVRPIGAEAKKAALAMRQGLHLGPAALGFLAGIGETEVAVYPPPAVAVIVTGKELQQPGTELAFGQVYESNSYALTAALRAARINHITLYTADDDLAELTAVLQQALQDHQVVLLTGGVSVGDYDFVLRAATQLSIRQVFHKVKQKPGKPLYFGTSADKLVFGLPGNPSSVLSCFYHYVLPALAAMMQVKSGLQIQEAALTHAYNKTAGLTHFLKAHYAEGKVTPLHAQESFRMSSFAAANCMVELPEQQTQFAAGSRVRVHIFPE